MDDVTELGKRLAAAARMRDPVERARALRELTAVVPPVLARAADAAVFEATRASTRAVVAERLGVSESAIDKAVRQHRKAAASGD